MKIDPHKIKNPKNSEISEFSKIMNFLPDEISADKEPNFTYKFKVIFST